MSHNHHGGAFGALALVAAIAFAFGPRTARAVVGGALLVALMAFLYVTFRVITGTI